MARRKNSDKERFTHTVSFVVDKETYKKLKTLCKNISMGEILRKAVKILLNEI